MSPRPRYKLRTGWTFEKVKPVPDEQIRLAILEPAAYTYTQARRDARMWEAGQEAALKRVN